MGKEKDNGFDKEKKDNKRAEKKEKNNTEKKKESKISKKTIIIVVLSILVVALACIIGWLVWNNSQADKTTGSEWSDKYYEFLKNQNKNNKLNWLFEDKTEISFVESKEIEDPIMLVKSDKKCDLDKNGCESIQVLGIVDGEVQWFSGYTASNVDSKLYYDIEKKEYKYYIKNGFENNDMYYSLDTIVTDHEKYDAYKEAEKRGITDYSSEEYSNLITEIVEKMEKDPTREVININKENEKVVQETVDGKTIEYNTIDSKLVDTGVESEYFDYDKDMKPIEIRKKVIEGKNEYKELDKQVSKAIEKVVKKQVDLIEKTKQDIEKAKADKAAAEEAKRAEEEKKKAEEAAKAGLKVGNYTLKYGKYVGEAAAEGITLVLSPNGQCTYNGASCTYTIGTYDFAQDESTRGSYHTCLIVNADYTYHLMPYSNTSIGDGDINSFNFSG